MFEHKYCLLRDEVSFQTARPHICQVSLLTSITTSALLFAEANPLAVRSEIAEYVSHCLSRGNTSLPLVQMRPAPLHTLYIYREDST